MLKLLAVTLLLGVAAPFAAAQTFAAPAQAGERLNVTVGGATPVSAVSTFARLAVAEPEIADATPTSDRSFYVRGRKSGTTNILLYSADGRLVQAIDVRVAHDIAAIRNDIALLHPTAQVRLAAIADRVHVGGEAPDARARKDILAIVESHAPERVIDALEVGLPEQVLLEVRFVEASREDIREIGFGADISRPGDFVFSTASSLVSGQPPRALGALFGGSGATTIDAYLRALEEKGVVRTLAEPNLVARSGESASFLAGGEFPVPVAAEDNTVTIEFKDFGVSLDFVPTVLNRNEISLRVMPEVSQLDPRNTVRLADIEIPALSVRKVDTTVELADGESFAVAGLIQNTADSTSLRTPFLADLPIVGALFRSDRFRANETELIVIITPRLVGPAQSMAQLDDPLKGEAEPTTADRLLTGNLRVQTGRALGDAVRNNIAVQTGTATEPGA